VLGDVAHALLGLAALGDVGKDPDVVGWGAGVRIVDARRPDADRNVVAALAGDLQLAVPAAALGDQRLQAVGS
jgi:hypothetical protein